MANKVPPEINDPRVLIVGRDPGAREDALLRPFVGDAGDVLMEAMRSIGKGRKDASYANVVPWRPPRNEFYLHDPRNINTGVDELHRLIAQLKPNIIIAVGNEAAWATVDGWPSLHGKGIMRATGIEKRRGYIWTGRHGGKVLTTLHPSAVMRDRSGISEMLFTHDLEKAFNESGSPILRRPTRKVHIVDSRAAAVEAVRVIAAADVVACDIEISSGPDHRCACVGFATSPERAYVFVADALEDAYDLLRNPALTTVWQNGQFDLHFLLTRHGVRVAGRIEDTIVAWHALWPEIAGKAQDIVEGDRRGGAKRTNKGLAFLASLYTNDAWWKDYDFETEQQKWLLNGRDCCITLDIFQKLQSELRDRGAIGAYVMTLDRIWPCVEMQAHGLLVDEEVRRDSITKLTAMRDAAVTELMELALEPLTAARARLSKPHLIWHRTVCPCCRNGAKKKAACFECEGFEAMPKKPELLALAQRNIRRSDATPQEKAQRLEGLKKLKAAEPVPLALSPCRACDGRGEDEEYAFNPASDEQMGMLLFEALRLPTRAGVDEASLKSLLGVLS